MDRNSVIANINPALPSQNRDVLRAAFRAFSFLNFDLALITDCFIKSRSVRYFEWLRQGVIQINTKVLREHSNSAKYVCYERHILIQSVVFPCILCAGMHLLQIKE